MADISSLVEQARIITAWTGCMRSSIWAAMIVIPGATAFRWKRKSWFASSPGGVFRIPRGQVPHPLRCRPQFRLRHLPASRRFQRFRNLKVRLNTAPFHLKIKIAFELTAFPPKRLRLRGPRETLWIEWWLGPTKVLALNREHGKSAAPGKRVRVQPRPWPQVPVNQGLKDFLAFAGSSHPKLGKSPLGTRILLF